MIIIILMMMMMMMVMILGSSSTRINPLKSSKMRWHLTSKAISFSKPFCQELERQGFNLPEELVKAAIKEAKLIDDRDLARAAR